MMVFAIMYLASDSTQNTIDYLKAFVYNDHFEPAECPFTK